MSPEPRRLHRAAIAVYAVDALREARSRCWSVRASASSGAASTRRARARRDLRSARSASRLDRPATCAGADHDVVGDAGGGPPPQRAGRHQGDRRPAEPHPGARPRAGPVQRLFGVYAVHVQTGGGGAKGEIVLEAIGEDDVRELRELVGGQAPGRRPRRRRRERRLARAAAARRAHGRPARRDPAGARGPPPARPERVRRGAATRRSACSRHGHGELVLAVVALLVAAWLLSVPAP